MTEPITDGNIVNALTAHCQNDGSDTYGVPGGWDTSAVTKLGAALDFMIYLYNENDDCDFSGAEKWNTENVVSLGNPLEYHGSVDEAFWMHTAFWDTTKTGGSFDFDFVQPCPSGRSSKTYVDKKRVTFGSLEDRCHPAYDDLVESVSQLTLKLEEIDEELEEKQQNFNFCMAEVDSLYKDVTLISTGYQEELDSLYIEIDGLEDNIMDCDGEYWQLQDSYDSAIELSTACEDRASFLEGLNTSLSTQVANMSISLSDKEAKVAGLEQVLADARETHLMDKGALAHQVKTCNDAVKAATILTSSLESKLDETLANLSSVSSALDALREQPPSVCNAAHAGLSSANMGLAYFLGGFLCCIRILL